MRTQEKNGKSKELLPCVLISNSNVPMKSTMKRTNVKAEPKSIFSSSPIEHQNLTNSARFAPLVHWDEVSAWGYDKLKWMTLTHSIKAENAKFEKATLFTARWYKLMATTLTDKEMSSWATAIFDTGHSPDLIKKNVQPASWRVDVPSMRASMKAVADTAFKVKDSIFLLFKIGWHKTKAVYKATSSLATKKTLDKACK